MPISPKSLFHFTRTKDSLEGILRDDFYISYCREKVILNSGYREYYVPMVSFCDIPLALIRDHVGKYGNYGIGMTREWAIKNGLNPVLYIEKNSTLGGSVEGAISQIESAEGGWRDLESHEQALADVMRYLKNYEADLERKSEIIPSYRYSDEREWRYVPPATADFSMIISASAHHNEKFELDVKRDKQLLARERLRFEPNDIKYIIIDSESEISEFIGILRKFKKKYSSEDVDRLTTRLLTTEQIKDDI